MPVRRDQRRGSDGHERRPPIGIGRMAGHRRPLPANGCNGLAVPGTTGKANSPPRPERRRTRS